VRLADVWNNATATELLADQWIMVNKGAQTALSNPDLEITSGSIFLDTMEWKNASKLESNAFCGGMGHTTTKDMVMVGGHSQVYEAALWLRTATCGPKSEISSSLLT
jgi:hypothetical protein